MPSVSKTLLDQLRSRSIVDCDTLDADVAASLGPFEDCTSNQAIALFELSQHRHGGLVKEAAALAKKYAEEFREISLPALAVEIGMILLALRISSNLKGYSHIQVNPFDAYSTAATIAGALRINSLLKRLSPPTSRKPRLCVKIPSTHAGLLACAALEKQHNVRTLATTLFTTSQAILAAKAGCTYVAPYVNELKVHFEKGYVDPAPAVGMCREIQDIYDGSGGKWKTQVLAASLTSVAEVMSLAGVAHITVAPALLQQLADTEVSDGTSMTDSFPSVFDNAPATNGKEADDVRNDTYDGDLEDEPAFRMALTRHHDGREEAKLIQAINIFCDCQEKLEALMADVLDS